MDIKPLIERFLTWPVPASVYPDGTPGKPGRTGTNLLSYDETRQMLEHVLGDLANVFTKVPEGCTPTDARILREANHAFAQESHELQDALADLYVQIKAFVAVNGEADFETGRALHLLSRLRPLEFVWPFTEPPIPSVSKEQAEPLTNTTTKGIAVPFMMYEQRGLTTYHVLCQKAPTLTASAAAILGAAGVDTLNYNLHRHPGLNDPLNRSEALILQPDGSSAFIAVPHASNGSGR